MEDWVTGNTLPYALRSLLMKFDNGWITDHW